MAKNSDKLNAYAGIAAVSAVIAMVLILSNLFILVPLVSDLVRQMPAWTGSVEEMFNQLIQVKVQFPSNTDGLALVAMTGFMALSISTTVAASKIAK